MGGRGATSGMRPGNSLGASGLSSITRNAEGADKFQDYIDRHGSFMSAEERADLRERGLSVNTRLQLFIDDNDAYGKADVLNSDEFEAFVDDSGATVYYRGMPDSENDGNRATGKSKHENFMYDPEYFVGSGIFGDGMYFTTAREMAENYAEGGSNSGAIIRMALKPGARVIKYSDVYDMAKAVNLDYTDDDTLSAFAMSKGYDAIREGGLIAVLNRSAVVVDSNIEEYRK